MTMNTLKLKTLSIYGAALAASLTLAACQDDDPVQSPKPADMEALDMRQAPPADMAADQAQPPEDMTSTPPDAAPDMPEHQDMRVDMTPAEDMNVEAPTARTYCASTRELFCDYYMRCGRINATSMRECLRLFDETCEAVYQPRYVALEDVGALSLSSTAIDACRAHLQTVTCEQQRSDLDGPCGKLWVGQRPAGSACAPGIESLVCGAGSTCVLTTNGCGSCRETVPAGQACGPDIARCESDATCLNGACVKRSQYGESCGDDAPCVLGLSCIAGLCRGPSVVAVGEACDQGNRCPYNALCEQGICQSQRGLGDVCESSWQCRSGRCEPTTKVCQDRAELNSPCAASDECKSGLCRDGACVPFLSRCEAP